MAKADATPPPPDPRRQLTLNQVLGNEDLHAFLRRAWRQQRMPQAILFGGPAGIGKTTTAWALAREIVSDGGDPATHPRSLKVTRNSHPDIIEVTGKNTASSQISVESIRNLERFTATGPLESPKKIVLIEPADRMNTSSANCLLKLLEEPPPDLLLFLVTPEPNRLLTTIRSRCTPLMLEPVPINRLTPWLMKETRLDETKARLIASLSEGRPGYALLLAKSRGLGDRGKILEAFNRLAKHGFSAVFGVAETLGSASGDLSESLETAMTLLRDALVIKLRGPQGILHQDLAAELGAFAEQRSAAGLLEAAQILERAAAEAPSFYSVQSKAHFTDLLAIEVGRLLRS